MILALDPGTWKTGWCLMSLQGHVHEHGHRDNHWVADYVSVAPANHLAIEEIVGQGRKAVGKDTFQTCRWIGRFEQQWFLRTGNPATLYSRQEALRALSNPKGDTQVAHEIRHHMGRCRDNEVCRPKCRQKDCHLWNTNSHSRAAIAVAWRFLQEINPQT